MHLLFGGSAGAGSNPEVYKIYLLSVFVSVANGVDQDQLDLFVKCRTVHPPLPVKSLSLLLS
jgi:hypothetical protein